MLTMLKLVTVIMIVIPLLYLRSQSFGKMVTLVKMVTMMAMITMVMITMIEILSALTEPAHLRHFGTWLFIFLVKIQFSHIFPASAWSPYHTVHCISPFSGAQNRKGLRAVESQTPLSLRRQSFGKETKWRQFSVPCAMCI